MQPWVLHDCNSEAEEEPRAAPGVSRRNGSCRQRAGIPPGVGFSAQSTEGAESLRGTRLYSLWSSRSRDSAQERVDTSRQGGGRESGHGNWHPGPDHKGSAIYTSFWIFREEGQKGEQTGRALFFLCRPSCILPTPSANVWRQNTHLW